MAVLVVIFTVALTQLMKTVGSSQCPFLYIAGTPIESPQASTDTAAQSRQLPKIEHSVTLDYSVLNGGVRLQSCSHQS